MEPVALEKPPPVRQTARFAPETLIRPPSRAPNRPICSRDPHPAPSRAPNRPICSRDPHPAPPVRQTALFAPETLFRPPPVRQTALFAPEGLHRAAPVRQTALFAPETLIQPPPVRQTALFAHETLIRPLPCAKPPCLLPRPSSGLLPCAKPPYLLTTNEYNAGWPHFLHSFKSCRKSSSQEYATGGSMVFFGTGRSIDPSPPAILAIFSIRSAGSSGLKKATLPHPADVS